MKIRYIEYENDRWRVEREVKGWFRTRWESMIGCYWKGELTGALWYSPRGPSSSHRTYRSRFDSLVEAKEVLAKWIMNEIELKEARKELRTIEAEITVDVGQAFLLIESGKKKTV